MTREHSRGLAAADQSLFRRIASFHRRQTLKAWLIDLIGLLIIVAGIIALMFSLEGFRP